MCERQAQTKPKEGTLLLTLPPGKPGKPGKSAKEGMRALQLLALNRSHRKYPHLAFLPHTSTSENPHFPQLRVWQRAFTLASRRPNNPTTTFLLACLILFSIEWLWLRVLLIITGSALFSSVAPASSTDFHPFQRTSRFPTSRPSSASQPLLTSWLLLFVNPAQPSASSPSWRRPCQLSSRSCSNSAAWASTKLPSLSTHAYDPIPHSTPHHHSCVALTLLTFHAPVIDSRIRLLHLSSRQEGRGLIPRSAYRRPQERQQCHPAPHQGRQRNHALVAPSHCLEGAVEDTPDL